MLTYMGYYQCKLYKPLPPFKYGTVEGHQCLPSPQTSYNETLFSSVLLDGETLSITLGNEYVVGRRVNIMTSFEPECRNALWFQ